MSTAVIQPVHDTNNHQVLALLDNSSVSSEERQEVSIMTEEEEAEQKQQILNYLNKPSPIPSFNTTTKRAPRLGPFLLLKTLGVGEFGKVKMGRHFETGQTVRRNPEILLFINNNNNNKLGGCQTCEKREYRLFITT